MNVGGSKSHELDVQHMSKLMIWHFAITHQIALDTKNALYWQSSHLGSIIFRLH